MVAVYFIRHGESGWNAEQGRLRAAGEHTEAQIATIAHDLAYMDSPLSVAGVKQALSLASLLFANISRDPAVHQRTLKELVMCAQAGSCPKPRLLSSNLRRAIDTMLLGLRPLIQEASPSVLSVPALQETSPHSDCVPLPRSKDGSILFGVAAAEGTSAHVSAVLHSQVAALNMAEASVGTEPLIPYIRRVYRELITVMEHGQYYDGRNVPAGTIAGRDVRPAQATAEAMRPFMSRMHDVLSLLLEELRGAPLTAARPVVIAGHSRFLREMLFAFHSAQATEDPRGEQRMHLRWGEDNAPACASLCEEGVKISNTGAVAFEIDECVPPECARPTLTLGACRLDADAKVLPRRPTHHGVAKRPPFSTILEDLPPWACLLAVIVAALIAVPLARRYRMDRRQMLRGRKAS
uniref:Uncharacterized protein n=1 Tax=Coccolithus braarudii TaxID=221442 RepID=A0A7S0PY42_9EUKA|mmetsp:Transcript_15711/g.34064  ORF Transcript_15711/g.34064 Transcript_15711/m.34064 type:complete len:408 (+) Transcript_15711:24-1247(+)